MLKKIVAIILVVLLLWNLLYIAMGRITDFIFWLNLAVLFAISYLLFGDKSKLKKMLKLN